MNQLYGEDSILGWIWGEQYSEAVTCWTIDVTWTIRHEQTTSRWTVRMVGIRRAEHSEQTWTILVRTLNNHSWKPPPCKSKTSHHVMITDVQKWSKMDQIFGSILGLFLECRNQNYGPIWNQTKVEELSPWSLVQSALLFDSSGKSDFAQDQSRATFRQGTTLMQTGPQMQTLWPGWDLIWPRSTEPSSPCHRSDMRWYELRDICLGGAS